MTYKNPDSLVSTEWVAQHMDAPDVRIVDATYFLPNVDRDARAEYEAQHIPGAVFFDVDDVKDPESDLPHMMPPPEVFSSKVRKLGLGDGLRIVCYDANGGPMAAARVWWMFRVFGHDDVAVMDGGLPKWLAEDRPVTDEETIPQERHFTARLDNTRLRSLEQMLALVENHNEVIVDARPKPRYAGRMPEPREGARLGHMPGALSLPYMSMCDEHNNFVMRSAEEIREIAEKQGIDLAKPLALHCGSGVSACFDVFALHLIGKEDCAVYDGSWAEWGFRDDTPIEK